MLSAITHFVAHLFLFIGYSLKYLGIVKSHDVTEFCCSFGYLILLLAITTSFFFNKKRDKGKGEE
jgi:hypothetical protein